MTDLRVALADDQHLVRRLPDQVAHHGRADEAGATGDEIALHDWAS